MATVREIAAATGLSTATVSRALRGQSCVTEKTMRMVMDAAGKLGSPAAHQHMGDCIVTLSSPYEKQITPMMIAISGISETGNSSGFKVFNYTISDPKSISSIVDMFNEGIFAGMVIPELPSELLPLVEKAEKKDRIIQCCGRNPSLKVPAVVIDDRAAARKATEYLISLGHRNIGVLAHSAQRSYSRIRLDTYLRVMQENGLKTRDSWIYNVNSNRYEFAYQVARSALLKPDRPSAFFAFTDYFALALVNAAQDLGISIPGEVSVIGCDDLELAHIKTPSITTIRQPFEHIGNITCSLLISAIHGNPASRLEYFVDADLIIRETTGPVQN